MLLNEELQEQKDKKQKLEDKTELEWEKWMKISIKRITLGIRR